MPTDSQGKSDFRGVRHYRKGWVFQTRRVNGRRTEIGPFDTAEEAARAYDEYQRRRWRDKAITNF